MCAAAHKHPYVKTSVNITAHALNINHRKVRKVIWLRSLKRRINVRDVSVDGRAV